MSSTLLPSIGHAASGATGTIISTLLTYPLDLVNTRLKVQRQLRSDGAIRPEDEYDSVLDAFVTIYNKEGGASAFFAGLGADLAKSAADSFLFFLFYTWFRTHRLVGRKNLPYLKVLEELAVGASAGACAKLFTTPVSNVVTRRQMANFLNSASSPTSSSSSPTSPKSRSPSPSFAETVNQIKKEKGGTFRGLWAGYSASLVLTLNPSLTFFCQQILKRLIIGRRREQNWDDPGAKLTFLLAATSKVLATSVTYPFQIAKARMQVGVRGQQDDENKKGGQRGGGGGDGIFATLERIRRTEGVRALYDGIGGELLKGFFNHGTTMLSKDLVHGLIVRLYFFILGLTARWPQIRARLVARLTEARRKRMTMSAEGLEIRVGRGQKFVEDVLGGGRKLLGVVEIKD
ncbi:mitochondrial carrier domain-containing protein [Cladorrhinum samala]|uniref:Mitochondrial carrier domain-containing protein n=1 Tax=Cladorrhinum samala TaxID=585594 RepID=A0AAV9HG47_9PEZI|nr:mitochondrial carrier domain-containing protein [Cladorrhinum samala]